MQIEDELRKIRMLLEAQTKASGILSYVNQYVVGRNEGGGYIRVFSSHLGFSVGAIYENKFHELPNLPEWKEWIESVKREIAGKRSVKAPITEKGDAEERNALKDLPSPLMVVFYQFSNAEKQKKNFGGVYAVLPKPIKIESKVEVTGNVFDPQAVPVFNSKDDALKWAVQMTLYPNVNEAEAGFDGVKNSLIKKFTELNKNLNSTIMFTHWIAHVRETVKLIEQSEGKQ